MDIRSLRTSDTGSHGAAAYGTFSRKTCSDSPCAVAPYTGTCANRALADDGVLCACAEGMFGDVTESKLPPPPSTCENTCTPKGNAAEWAALGCVVSGSPTANTVSALGTPSAAPGYHSCSIACPIHGQGFVVSAQVNTCTPKGNAAEWAALGCVVSGSPTANTVSALGTPSAAPGYHSCSIACPASNGPFVVNQTVCSRGKYRAHATETECSACPGGTFLSDNAVLAASHVSPLNCTNCGVNEYSSPGAGTCTTCPKGQFTRVRVPTLRADHDRSNDCLLPPAITNTVPRVISTWGRSNVSFYGKHFGTNTSDIEISINNIACSNVRRINATYIVADVLPGTGARYPINVSV
eukprot:Stramenopile-MAST_4_protein_5512